METKKEYGADGSILRESDYNENGELIKERVYGPTPAGGAYSECYYRDGKPCEICEFMTDGTMLVSTYL